MEGGPAGKVQLRLVSTPPENARHPHREQLERFMRGELPRSEAPAVVRHLLAGCPQCVKVTCPLWPGRHAPALRKALGDMVGRIRLALYDRRRLLESDGL